MKIIGHRGARGLAPENTVASIQKAIEHNVDEVEFDLRVTKDKIVILHHDRHVRNRSGNKLLVSTSSYSDLKAHKADLATLDDILAVIGSTPLYIEVKPKVNIKPIVKILKDMPASRKIHLGSKNQKTLLELHKALPDIPKIVIHPWSGVIAHHRAKQVDTKRISMNQLWLWSGFIKAVSQNGTQLSAYTLNDPKKAKRWQKHGLYGVITDYPDLFDR